MQIPLQSALRICLTSNCRRLQFRFSSLLSPPLQGKPVHLWAARLNILNEKNILLRNFSSLPLQTTFGDSVLLSAGFHSDAHGAGVPARNFSISARKSAKELSEKGDLVYRGTISGMIKGVKIFSISTSVIGICLQPMLLFSNQELPTALKLVLGGFINFFVFMNPFIIHYIAKKYVTELRWNRRTGMFTASTLSFLVQRKELQFTAEDVKVPDIPGMFTSLEAKGTPLFLDPQAFEDSEAYIHLMGFDKPLDWEIPQHQNPSAKESTQKR